ncbi:peptide ABC transporter substrate-binding protein [uncultured Fretibacterium sp.]|uniref:peptide ABC transporter substrate-binding protein n=1 Tax=uncultured Fretibacterium sp. TaxID=1678694 RepID=UPI00325FA81B
MARGVRCLLALMAALFLAGTGAAVEGEIVFNLAVEPQTIDPVRNNAVDGSNVIFNLFDGLVRIGFDDAPEPGCAERWEVSEDGMTWTFHLRKGLKWSDGKPLTAEDFRYGLLRLLDARNASPNAYMAYFLKNGEAFFNGKAGSEDVGIDVPDDATLRLRLENPAPLMLDCLSFYAFAPARADVVEQDPRGWATKPESLVSNGPFVLSEWKHNSELTLTKNPNYWDADNVKIDKVRMVMITDSNTALAAFKAGKVDLLDRIPPQMTPQLIQSGEAKVAPALGTAFCVFNVARAPFDDPRVRKAFTLAIDRRTMVEKVTLGGQKPAVAFIPYGIPGAGSDRDFRAEGGTFLPERADPEAAKKLLAEAGYPDGKGFPKVAYKYNLSSTNKAIAEALQAMWKQNLGVEVELANEEWKVFLNTREQGDFQIARHAYVTIFFDAGSLLEGWVTGSPKNVARYSDPEYDALIRDSLKQMDRSKRMEDMHRAEAILMRDLPVLPLYFYSTPYMQSARVKGIYISPRSWVLFRGAEVAE